MWIDEGLQKRKQPLLILNRIFKRLPGIEDDICLFLRLVFLLFADDEDDDDNNDDDNYP